MLHDDICEWCGELVAPEERAGTTVTTIHNGDGVLHRPLHYYCAVRMVTGSLSCLSKGPHTVGSCDGDDPAISKRLAAKAAYYYWKTHGQQLPQLIK